jgi:hypothetical protein
VAKSANDGDGTGRSRSKPWPYLRFYLEQFRPLRTLALSSLLSLIIPLPAWMGWYQPSRVEQEAWVSFLFVMAVCWFASAFWTSPYVGGPNYVSALSTLPARLQDIYQGFSLSRFVCGAALFLPPVLALATVLRDQEQWLRLAAIFALSVAFNDYFVFATLFRRVTFSAALLAVPLACWGSIVLLPATHPLPLLLALSFGAVCHAGGMYTVSTTGLLHIHHGTPASETAFRGAESAGEGGWRWVDRLPPLSRILLRRSREKYPWIISYTFVFLIVFFVGYLPFTRRDLWFIFLAGTIVWALPNNVLRQALTLFALPLRRRERRYVFHALHVPTLVATLLMLLFFSFDLDLYGVPAPSVLERARYVHLRPVVAAPRSSRAYLLWRLGGDIDAEAWNERVARVERRYVDEQARITELIRERAKITRELRAIDRRTVDRRQNRERTGGESGAGAAAAARSGALTARRRELERALERVERKLERSIRQADAIRAGFGRLYLGDDERDRDYAVRQVSTYLWNNYGLADPATGYSIETGEGGWEVRTSRLDGDLRRIRSRHRVLVILIGVLFSMWNLRLVLPGGRREGLTRLWDTLFSWKAILASIALGSITFGAVFVFLFFSTSSVSIGYYPELVPSWRGAVFHVAHQYYCPIAVGGLTACALLYRRNLKNFQYTETRFGRMRRMW